MSFMEEVMRWESPVEKKGKGNENDDILKITSLVLQINSTFPGVLWQKKMHDNK